MKGRRGLEGKKRPGRRSNGGGEAGRSGGHGARRFGWPSCGTVWDGYCASWEVFLSRVPLLPVIFDFLTLYSVLFAQVLYAGGIEGPLSVVLLNVPNPDRAVAVDVAMVFGFTFLYYLFVYVCLSFFQYYAWRYAFVLCGYSTRGIASGKKLSDVISFPAVFLRNLVWIGLYFVIDVVHNVVSVLNRITGVAFFNEGMLNTLYYGSFVVMFYFVMIQYSTGRTLRKTLEHGTKKAKLFILKYVIVLLTFMVINLILGAAAMYSLSLNVVLGICLLFPMVTWVRVYYIKGG